MASATRGLADPHGLHCVGCLPHDVEALTLQEDPRHGAEVGMVIDDRDPLSHRLMVVTKRSSVIRVDPYPPEPARSWVRANPDLGSGSAPTTASLARRRVGPWRRSNPDSEEA
jgi:hypothetical protein